MFTCLNLCSLHALCHLPCACAPYAMFVCLDLGYVNHAICYCSLFIAFDFLSNVLAYWLRPDLNPMVFVIVHTQRPTSKGLDHPICMSMLYACASLTCSRLCHAWRPPQAWSCLVTSDVHEALFGCDHFGSIFGCRVASYILVCCHRQPKIKPILLKIYVVVQVRIVPTESI